MYIFHSIYIYTYTCIQVYRNKTGWQKNNNYRQYNLSTVVIQE